MKKLVYLLLAFIVLACASSKLAMVPVGSWDYTITGTPSGDFAGVLIVTMDGDKYAAVLKSQAGEIKIDGPTYDKTTKKLSGTFDFDGTTIFFDTTTEGDAMNGTVSAGGGSWPFKGTRKK
jgi:hemolysin activation/secretion protein